MKRINYILLPALTLLFAATACSEKEEMTAEERTPIEGIIPMMEGMASSSAESSSTRGTLAGFSVNTIADPTKKELADRGNAGWKMDLTLYNGGNSYTDGSFTGATYSSSTWEVPADKYFPNYKKPQAEVLLYPAAWNPTTSTVATVQSTDALLFDQDVLVKAQGAIEVSHTPTITLNHKHSMLDFVIKDVVASDITVTVELEGTSYTPYKVSASDAKDLEYMLILPEDTQTNPVIKIVTNEVDNQSAITYRQTIGIIDNGTTSLGSNNCYCFSLQGAELKISPVTVLNWATGKSLPGEYIAVTAYPTFKAEGYANQTFYFYYDNKLKENNQEKLQEIKFNENGECTIKPDGRILTHIYKADEVEEIGNGSSNKTPKTDAVGNSVNIILGKMLIELTSADLPN